MSLTVPVKTSQTKEKPISASSQISGPAHKSGGGAATERHSLPAAEADCLIQERQKTFADDSNPEPADPVQVAAPHQRIQTKDITKAAENEGTSDGADFTETWSHWMG